ncbi:DUF6268 family outer membrane beta-barrel protein [Ferrimonas gelatinilytica]|uniref:DUF6268 family outer membrane beta-barrel protein n=1 Tax=Ferrimonas gelatinilytica TaxID=1255257 RepID=A0ABP9RXY3_9GAMM
MKSLYLLLLATLSLSAHARPPAPPPWTLDIYGIQMQKGELAQDGDFDDSELGLQFGYSTRLGPKWILGARVNYDYRRFDFDRTALFDGALETWSHRQRVGLGFNAIHLLNQRWSLILAPRVQWSAAQEASLSDGFSYGLLAGGMAKVNPDLQLGVGFSYLNDVKDTTFFPIILVKWQISERWKLDNPFEPGFSGGAGLELSYRWNPHYEFAFGGAYRSDRFVVNDGAVETQAPLAFLRWSYFPEGDWDLSILLGYRFSGEMEWDPNGSGRRKQNIDARLGVGASLAFKF